MAHKDVSSGGRRCRGRCCRSVRRTADTTADKDDGDAGVCRGAILQHLLRACSADMLLRRIPLHHEASIPILFNFYSIMIERFLWPINYERDKKIVDKAIN